MNDLISYAKMKNKSINLDGIVIQPENKISKCKILLFIKHLFFSKGIKENYLESFFNVASVLQYHKNNAGIISELNKYIGMKNKNDGKT